MALQGDEQLGRRELYKDLRHAGVAAHLDLMRCVTASDAFKGIKPTEDELAAHKEEGKKSKWKASAKLGAVHQRMVGSALQNAHAADADVKGMMKVAQLPRPTQLIIDATAKEGLAAWSQVQLRAEGLAAQYAKEHAGFSRPPYGKALPVCEGHCYPVTLKQSWTEKNPGRWFGACNSSHENKPHKGLSRKCNHFQWVTEHPLNLTCPVVL